MHVLLQVYLLILSPIKIEQGSRQWIAFEAALAFVSILKSGRYRNFLNSTGMWRRQRELCEKILHEISSDSSLKLSN